MTHQFILVTPELARDYLTRNKSNRRLRQNIVSKYAQDMRDGLWKQTHQGLAFYSNGDIADGQHRLHAVIQSGSSIPFLVSFDVPDDARIAIDQNASRTILDAFSICGESEWWADKNAIAVCRSLMMKDGSDTKYSASVVRRYALTHESKIRPIVGLFKGKRKAVTNASLTSCYVLAAYHGVSIDVLVRFEQCLISGLVKDESEHAAIRFREFLLHNRGVWSSGIRTQTMRRAQRAIQAFEKGQPLDRLHLPQSFIYPFFD